MNKKKRVLYVLQIVLFLVLLGAGSGAIILGVCEGKTYSELEKRELKKFPELTAQNIFDGTFESELTDALSDHIWGRDGFVTAKTRAEVLLGKREIDGIYIDGDRLIETYKDGDFDDKQIRENEAYVAEFLSGVAGNIGADHVKVALVPSKCSLYRDHMPSYMSLSNRSDTIATELREKLAEELPKAAAELESDEEETAADEDTEDVSEDGFDFGEGDPDADSDAKGDDLGFDFDEGDPDAEKEEKDLGFDFDEGDPSKEEGSSAGENKGSTDVGKKDSSGDEKKASGESSKSGKSKKDSSTVDGSDNAEGNTGYAGLTDEEKQKKAKEDADRMVIDLRPVLKPHTDEYIYYLTDHHWTSLGARYAYQELREALGFEDKNTTESETAVADDFLGTDYNRIHYYQKPDVIHRYDIPEANTASIEINDSGEKKKYNSIYDEKSLKTADKYNYFFSGNYSAITVNTDAKNDKTMLLIKDSFSNALVPFLCQDYKTIIMVDLRYVNSSATDYLPEGKVPDDVLIVYNEEKFMQDTHQMNLN